MIARTFRPCLYLLAAALAVPGWSFVFYPVGNNPLRWNVDSPLTHTNVVNRATRAVRYYIASDAFSAANREAEIAAVRASFDQWQSITGSSLKFEFAGLLSPQGLDVREDHTNVIFWAKNSLRVKNGEMNLFGLPGWTSVNFAPDGTILEADIVLNGNQYEWFTDFNNTISQAQFIECVLLHEIGHFVGLDHAVAGGATVFSGGNGITAEAGLCADEIAAMRFLYPAAPSNTSAIKGFVRMNGSGILGAVITAEDIHGNLANATVSRADGSYDLPGLEAGAYQLRVSPLDPANAGSEKLIRGVDVAPEYANAITTFAATPARPVTLAPSQTVMEDFTVTAGPGFRISSVSKPTTIPNLVSVFRHAMTVLPGQAGQFLAVSGPNLPADAALAITGNGLVIGPATFLENRIAPGLHSLVAEVSISASATPGLRSFVVTHSSGTAYANGFLEIATPVPDYNFDSLDDRFQRSFWTPWTAPEAAPDADPDDDGFSNRFEYLTGTNPTDLSSHRLTLAVSHHAGTNTLAWDADLGRRYQLYSRESLGTGSWQPSGRPFTATATKMIFTELASSHAKFYRLELQP